ncbi:protein of unknown function [Methylocaldum szegediense]|uniref:Uncharacterized protein n=1 Tax=Methylocaldum szegediense TaxID=73780 RepID=A0ABN8X4R8_9GAMM|nr:protein of unknown function [Methylocaldum szegediense]
MTEGKPERFHRGARAAPDVRISDYWRSERILDRVKGASQ